MDLLVFSQSTKLIVIQGGGIIKVHFCLVGGYGESRGRLVVRCTVRGNGHKLEKRRFQLYVKKIKSL